jgi:hypothetical protein
LVTPSGCAAIGIDPKAIGVTAPSLF